MWRSLLLVLSLTFPIISAADDDVPAEEWAAAPTAASLSESVAAPTEWSVPDDWASASIPCDGCPAGLYEPLNANQTWHASSEHPTVPKLTGFFHLDAVAVHQDAANIDTVGDVQDGVDFRRARIAAVGNISENIRYIMEFDFAASQALFVDDYVDFSEVPGLGHVRIGRWRQPFGMSPLTSIRSLPFMERPTAFAFVPFRQTGIGAYDTTFDEELTWAISAYRYPTFGFGDNVGDNGGWGLAGRITLLPLYEDDGDRLVHVGVDYSFNDPSNDQLRFQNTPEIFVGENAGAPVLPGTSPTIPPYVDTGVIPTRHVNQYGIEAAAACGSVSFQSEVYWATVQMLNGNSQTLPGAYAHVRWILTGERLPYEKSSGVFGMIDPQRSVGDGGIGAWELSARWSYINLNGTGFPGPGRQLNDATLGLNWYVHKNVKFQFNYIHAFLKDETIGDSNADFFGLRTQVHF